jgi:phosphate transport system protein
VTDRSERNEISAKLMDLAVLVESAMANAVVTLVDNSSTFAREIRSDDVRAHHLCLELERECLARLCSLEEPGPAQVRFLVGQIKIGVDLKRTGDEAKNILDRSMELRNAPLLPELTTVSRMLEVVESMHGDAVEALVNRDAAEAKQIVQRSRELGALKAETIERMSALMEETPDLVQAGVQVSLIACSLERAGGYLGDMALNVAGMFGDELRSVLEGQEGAGAGSETGIFSL